MATHVSENCAVVARKTAHMEKYLYSLCNQPSLPTFLLRIHKMIENIIYMVTNALSEYKTEHYQINSFINWFKFQLMKWYEFYNRKDIVALLIVNNETNSLRWKEYQ